MCSAFSSLNIEITTIYELGKILGSWLELHKTLRQVLNVIAAHLNVQRGMASTYENSECLGIIAAIGFSREEMQRDKFRAGEGITGSIFQTGVPAIVPNVEHEPLFLNRTGAKGVVEGQAISFLGVPIKVGRECVGVLSFERQGGERWRGFGNDMKLLTMAANLIGQAGLC